MSDFEHYDMHEKTDPCYGLERFEITENDIKHLKNGGKLYTTVNCDEYAIEIVLKEANNG